MSQAVLQPGQGLLFPGDVAAETGVSDLQAASGTPPLLKIAFQSAAQLCLEIGDQAVLGLVNGDRYPI